MLVFLHASFLLSCIPAILHSYVLLYFHISVIFCSYILMFLVLLHSCMLPFLHSSHSHVLHSILQFLIFPFVYYSILVFWRLHFHIFALSYFCSIHSHGLTSMHTCNLVFKILHSCILAFVYYCFFAFLHSCTDSTTRTGQVRQIVFDPKFQKNKEQKRYFFIWNTRPIIAFKKYQLLFEQFFFESQTFLF